MDAPTQLATPTTGTAPGIAPRAIVIVGGGVGAVEALLALADLGQGAFDITLVAPNDRFALRALTVAEPFAAGHHPDVAALADIAREAGATLRTAIVTSVDAERRVVACSDGTDLSYDALVLAPGARARKAYEPALTFGIGDPLALNGLLADLEQGYTHSVAFVVPDGVAWSLPLYEIALMTARQVHGMGVDVDLVLVTPEPAPLAVFGPEASAAVEALLAAAGIALHCGAPATVGRGRVTVPAAGLDLAAERIVSLPLLDGPRLAGVPANAAGFIAVDGFCRVRGLQDVYAIGDATDLAVKQGGLTCQQAYVAARHIAHAAGGPLDAEPLEPVLRGRLLSGGTDRFLRRDLAGPHGHAADEALWWPPAKVYGRYLGPWVADRQRIARPAARPDAAVAAPPGIDVALPLEPAAVAVPQAPEAYFSPRTLLGLDSLGAMRG